MAKATESVEVRTKLQRIAAGGPPRVLDLFSGCGGISLGFVRAGFEVVGNLEIDPRAAATHGFNFHRGQPEFEGPRDITSLSALSLAKDLNLGPVSAAVDVIVGGPPCQAFARVGRPKLREVADHPSAFKHDPRASLYLHYLDYVAAFKPLAILMENVPDVLNHGGQNIAEEVCDVLEDLGYVPRYSLLNSAFYGVPQMRERMFLVAYRRELRCDVEFPKPSNWLDLPVGYSGSRHVALKLLRHDLLGHHWRYVEAPNASSDLPAAISAKQAIGDLPPITDHLAGKHRRGARKFDNVVGYAPVKPSAFAALMRNWPGFEGGGGVSDHVIRYLPRDWKLFARMNAGDQYPEAHAHAERMFAERLRREARRGNELRRGSTDYLRLRKEFVPPYDAAKFPNKWRKMWPDQPARTLMAHLGKDTYSHIHYDSAQARTISVREAARLQSFPDGFIFKGSMNDAFRQIGNAVPPLMAAAIGERILSSIRKAARDADESQDVEQGRRVVGFP